MEGRQTNGFVRTIPPRFRSLYVFSPRPPRQSGIEANKQAPPLPMRLSKPGARHYHAAVVVIVDVDVEPIAAEHVIQEVHGTLAIAC